ncbi:MAG: hypothetical protein IIB99_06680 [Planctomycetes bacterium]|nr:hypothetical protein [Planctomycetota bacterium]MCH8211042.1 hypothetical protein [Planctomycetota bacterium]
MPSNFKSPHGSSFNTAVKNGTPCGIAIYSIAKRTGKNPSVVGNSLFRAGLVYRQKFNGHWVFWSVNGKRSSAAKFKPVHTQMWQCFIDWALCNGFCKPEQLKNHIGSQKEFMTFCRKFFAKQFGPATTSKRKRKSAKRTTSRKSTTTRARKSPARKPRPSSVHSYKFPRTSAARKRSVRRYRRAA